MSVMMYRAKSLLVQRVQFGMVQKACLSDVPSNEFAQSLRFNKIVDVYSPRVVSNIELKPGDKVILCRCWKSAKFPLCDGAHGKYNKETGDNIGPTVVTVPLQPQA